MDIQSKMVMNDNYEPLNLWHPIKEFDMHWPRAFTRPCTQLYSPVNVPTALPKLLKLGPGVGRQVKEMPHYRQRSHRAGRELAGGCTHPKEDDQEDNGTN